MLVIALETDLPGIRVDSLSEKLASFFGVEGVWSLGHLVVADPTSCHEILERVTVSSGEEPVCSFVGRAFVSSLFLVGHWFMLGGFGIKKGKFLSIYQPVIVE